MHPVDAILQLARQLLGASTPPDAGTADFGAPDLATEHPSSWQGAASADATARNTELDKNRAQLHTAYRSAATVIAAANQHG